MQKNKTTSLILLTCSLFAIILLAASLSNLNLESGIGFQTSNDGVLPDRTFETFIPEDSGVLIFIQGFFALVFLVFIIIIVARLIVNVDFKIVGIAVLGLVILVGISYLIPETSPNRTALSGGDTPIITPTTPATYEGNQTGETLPLLFWILLIIVSAGLVVMIFKSIQAWKKSPEIDTELIRDAEEALKALEAGLEIQNVILHCYFQMSNTLVEERGIEREQAMTVHEFEERLKQKGFPSAPVTQLTTLFEKIRYGDLKLQAVDEDIARDSLKEIVQFARRKGDYRQ